MDFTRIIAIFILFIVGGWLYKSLSKKVKLTWPKTIAAYAMGFAIIYFGTVVVDSQLIMWVGIIWIIVMGLVAFGKMSN
jgi:hypothetical protein|tara:strand:+ start:699 stop:935 length:237 start_codon:yes stop_codon:yes gene_type:complete